MEMTYENGKGDRYYFFQGATKTGKPKYYASKRETSQGGERIDTLPPEFEIFENPSNATVSVRRRKATRILPIEHELVERLAGELTAYSSVKTTVDGDRIVVYTPDRDPEEAAAALTRIFGSAPLLADEWTKCHTKYNAELRFTLQDGDERSYFAERYCYRGSIDDWIRISDSAPLETLAGELLPHLGRESLFELF